MDYQVVHTAGHGRAHVSITSGARDPAGQWTACGQRVTTRGVELLAQLSAWPQQGSLWCPACVNESADTMRTNRRSARPAVLGGADRPDVQQ
jgi:hypothetical protein